MKLWTALLLWVLTISSVRLTAQQFTVTRDVQYCTGGGHPLVMDVYVPQHRVRTPTPAVIWIHGGGWQMGDKENPPLAQPLAREGFVTASINYRLSGEAPFPAQIEDSKCAVRHLRANAAKYGIDPERIGVAGASAGGHLAELVATADQSAGLEGEGGWPNVSSKVQAAAAWFGASDFTVGEHEFNHRSGQPIVKLFRGTDREKPEMYRKASPITYVSKDDPPLFLAHGEQDELVPFNQSVRMADAYRKAGLKVEFVDVKNAGHGFRPAGTAAMSPSRQEIRDTTVEFFKKYLL